MIARPELNAAGLRTAIDKLVGMAIDNWVLTLRGRTESGKETTVVLSGPMLERQQEARQLLAARFPPPP